MQIRGLMLDPVTNMPIVVLKDVASDLVLPIWVGVFEANAIALELEKTATPRPMTHDLLRNMAKGLERWCARWWFRTCGRIRSTRLMWMDAGRGDGDDRRAAQRCDCAGAAVGLSDLRGNERCWGGRGR